VTLTRQKLLEGLVVLALFTAPFAACGTENDFPYDPGDEGEEPDGGGGGGGPANAKFFLPTGEPDNTSAPTVELDARGNLHIVYPAYAGGDSYYGFCPAGCDDDEDVKVVRFATEGTVHNAMIALDADGRPRVLLATGHNVYYATCAGDCTRQDAWTTTEILQHEGAREVTGEAFALDPEGRPRFMMHTYKAYLGIGQKPPEALYVACDADCHAPASWRQVKVADQMWRHSTLRFDARGTARLATVIGMNDTEVAGYVECAGDCDRSESWKGTGLMPVFASEVEAIRLTPSVSMALTRSGAPRVIILGAVEGQRNLTYFTCDADCAGQGWTGSIISTHDELGVGVDLALDANDRPRFVHTLDYNIALAYCDAADCAAQDAPWNLTKVEYGGEMKADQIFPYPNCTVGAWFLHSPSLALTADGRPRVGYQARDVSGGWHNPNPGTEPDCVAGTDMTWSRVAVMPGVK
jgi:hypothetical protein